HFSRRCPVGEDCNKSKRHIDDGHRCPSSFEKLVTHQTAQQGARNSRQFVDRGRPSCIGGAKTLCFLQKCRRPVDNPVSDEIDKCIRNRDKPQKSVVKDVFEEYLLSTKFLFLRFIISFRIIVFVFFDRR